jgi:hypothetical protein
MVKLVRRRRISKSPPYIGEDKQMGVFNRTPCFLHTSTTTGGYVDENGNRHKGETNYVKYIRCDVVPAGAAETRDFGDGKTVSYSYSVWIYDLNCRHIDAGEKVKLEKNGQLSKEFVVKGFHRYQTYCILWV